VDFQKGGSPAEAVNIALAAAGVASPQ